MMKRFREIFKQEEGFTLVELLVVIAVLGILASIAVPRLTGVRDRAELAVGNSALGSFNTAMGMYYAEYSTYATATDGKTALTKDNLETQVLSRYIDNVGELLGADWSITAYTGKEDSFSLTISNDDYNLTLDQSGKIEET